MLVTTGCPDEAIDSASGAVSVTASPARTVMPAAVAISSAARRRSKRSVWSGHTHACNQRTSVASPRSTGLRSMPSRVVITGIAVGTGTAPLVPHSSVTGDSRAHRSSRFVAVPVAVEEEIEPGARTDVEVGERTDLVGEQAERGQQQRAAADLVGLRAPARQCRCQLGLVACAEATQRRAADRRGRRSQSGWGSSAARSPSRPASRRA